MSMQEGVFPRVASPIQSRGASPVSRFVGPQSSPTFGSHHPRFNQGTVSPTGTSPYVSPYVRHCGPEEGKPTLDLGPDHLAQAELGRIYAEASQSYTSMASKLAQHHGICQFGAEFTNRAPPLELRMLLPELELAVDKIFDQVDLLRDRLQALACFQPRGRDHAVVQNVSSYVETEYRKARATYDQQRKLLRDLHVASPLTSPMISPALGKRLATAMTSPPRPHVGLHLGSPIWSENTRTPPTSNDTLYNDAYNNAGGRARAPSSVASDDNEPPFSAEDLRQVQGAVSAPRPAPPPAATKLLGPWPKDEGEEDSDDDDSPVAQLDASRSPFFSTLNAPRMR